MVARERVVRLTPRLLLNDIEAMLLAAQSGFGVARALSYQVVDALQAGTLVRLLTDFRAGGRAGSISLFQWRHDAARCEPFR